MAGWRVHKGAAVALDLENVDTDQLIPARFMSTPRSEGYGPFLLHDLRHDAEGALPLDRHPEASVLVTRRNFGSGSSREAAVYALVDFGIRVVVAPSFGDIFAGNAVNNGLLPARVESTDALMKALGDAALPSRANLETQELTLGNLSLRFELDPAWREKLMNGWDDIDLTRAHGGAIATFRARRAAEAPWIFADQSSEPTGKRKQT